MKEQCISCWDCAPPHMNVWRFASPWRLSPAFLPALMDSPICGEKLLPSDLFLLHSYPLGLPQTASPEPQGGHLPALPGAASCQNITGFLGNGLCLVSSQEESVPSVLLKTKHLLWRVFNKSFRLSLEIGFMNGLSYCLSCFILLTLCYCAAWCSICRSLVWNRSTHCYKLLASVITFPLKTTCFPIQKVFLPQIHKYCFF